MVKLTTLTRPAATAMSRPVAATSLAKRMPRLAPAQVGVRALHATRAVGAVLPPGEDPKQGGNSFWSVGGFLRPAPG